MIMIDASRTLRNPSMTHHARFLMRLNPARIALRGFTLIELMVVLVIIGVLAALIVPNVLDRADDARTTAARTDVANLMQALKLYKLDNMRFPTGEQGLQALVTKPSVGPIPPNWKPYLEMLYEMVGHPEKDKELLASASPALHADKIKTPLFIAQGAKDPRVNKAESDQMVEALKKRGVAVEYMVKDNEGHGFRNEENRFEFYEAMEKFLGTHLKK